MKPIQWNVLSEAEIEHMRSDEFFDSPHFDLSGGCESDAPGMYEKAHLTAERLAAEYRPRVPGAVTESFSGQFASRYAQKTLQRKFLFHSLTFCAFGSTIHHSC